MQASIWLNRLSFSARPRESGDPDGISDARMTSLDSRLRGNERKPLRRRDRNTL